VRECYSALEPYATGGVYVNFLADEGRARVRAAYGEERYGRLVALKRAYDPDNVLRLNQNIDPAGLDSAA
jgi:FAD/FMN-containing dehydrogenase